MEPRWGILLSLLCMLLSSRPASSRFVVESNSLQVTAPEEIKGKYESAIANFGMPQYGGVLGGMVVYPKANKDFCKKPSSKTPEFKAAPGQLPQVLLVDRGNCYFTLKVWYAQLAGASAVLIADDKDEALITMDAADGDKETDKYINNITIPSGLVGKTTADALKKALKKGNMVTVNLDWTEALPHPDERVEYELWTNSNDECGAKCDVQAQFMDAFRGFAQLLEKGGYTQFTPHYITWYCPPAYLDSKQCQSQCINNGRYCAPDPEEDFERGYDGKDVVLENLRQLCVFRVAKEKEAPWVWWDYVTDFKKRCRMADQLYNEECSKMVIESLGIDFEKVKECVGDTTADEDNEVLRGEQEAQVGKGDRGDVTILPTVIVNDRQYRGKLEAKAILKAVCSGFLEGTDPPACLGADIQTNECDTNNGGCWKGYNTSACKDTFRGRVCECPKDPNTGVNLVGDGYTSCEPAGVGRCLVNNGGCWSAEANGQRFTACQENVPGTGCQCPAGFVGDGYKCEDIDECTSNEHPRCRCPDCYCSNTYGSYDCTCSAGLVYITDGDQCISTSGGTPPRRLWIMISSIVLGSIVLVAIVGYIVYKYRLRSYMDSEIRAIMAQYMPLDSQNEPLTTRKDSSSALTGGV